MVYASLGAIIFALYLVYDTQIMLGGKHKLAVSPEGQLKPSDREKSQIIIFVLSVQNTFLPL